MTWLVLVLAMALSGLVSFQSSDISDNTTRAVFDGRIINMANDWEGAEACLVWPEMMAVPECFGTEKELDQRLFQLSISEHTLSVGPLAACATSLKLYDNTNYVTPVLSLAGSGLWMNLSTYGFDNKTSSYKVGACNATFADGTFGGTPRYPTNLTVAWYESPTMNSGWNNAVSSVFYSG